MNSDRINVYSCETCQDFIVTRDLEVGTTPMMLACRATRDCKGTMKSHWYPDDSVVSELTVTHVWYKPRGKEYRTLSPEMKEHVDQGGLKLRSVTGWRHANRKNMLR